MWTSVIGQHKVKEILHSAWRAERLPNAYLFFGDEGVGKSALAIEFARSLRCEQGRDEPCGVCSPCSRMRTLQDPDVKLVFALPVGKNEKSDDTPTAKLTEADITAIREQIALKAGDLYHPIVIPRATVIKINSIREIRRELALSRGAGGMKVVIILNAEDLGDEAANTLLKILEEPSPRTLFILTTSHRETLFPTVLSRCQHVQFSQLSEQEIQDALVSRKGIPQEQATLSARLANGSYTRAVALASEDIAAMRKDVLSFVRHALSKNTMDVMESVEALSKERNRDLVVQFLTLLQIWFRDALIISLDHEVINADQLEELRRFRGNLPDADLSTVIANIEDAISLVRRNVYIHLVLLHLVVQLRRTILPT